MITIQRFLSLGAVLGVAFVFSAGGCKKTDATDADPAAGTAQPASTTTGVQKTPLTGASGSTCSPNGAYGCSPDGIHEVHCVNGTWAQFRACRGPNKCSHVGNNTKCDFGPLMPGDVCNPPLNSMCTADHKGVLTCTNNRLTVTQTCTGGQTCKPGVGCK
jgi:hypothetical protein